MHFSDPNSRPACDYKQLYLKMLDINQRVTEILIEVQSECEELRILAGERGVDDDPLEEMVAEVE